MNWAANQHHGVIQRWQSSDYDNKQDGGLCSWWVLLQRWIPSQGLSSAHTLKTNFSGCVPLRTGSWCEWELLHPSSFPKLDCIKRCISSHLCFSHALWASLFPHRRDCPHEASRHWAPCCYVWFTLTENYFLRSLVDNQGPWVCSERCTQAFDEKVIKTKQRETIF